MKKLQLIIILSFTLMSSNAFAQYYKKGYEEKLNIPKGSYQGSESQKAISDQRSKKQSSNPSQYIKDTINPNATSSTSNKIKQKSPAQEFGITESKFSAEFGQGVNFNKSPVSSDPNTFFKTGIKSTSETIPKSNVKFNPASFKNQSSQKSIDLNSGTTQSVPKSLFKNLNEKDFKSTKPTSGINSKSKFGFGDKPLLESESKYDTKSKFDFGPAIKKKP